MPNQQAVLIATLGTEPQVITAALDLLRLQGERIEQVTAIHTAGSLPGIAAALRDLQAAFAAPQAGAALRLACVADEAGLPLPDVDTPAAAQAAFRVVYRETLSAKRQGLKVHLSIAGGRKTFAVFGMAAAQLLFDEDDRLWHLYSGGDFLAARRLHPLPGDEAHLIAIPVILWSRISPVLAGLEQIEDPFAAAERARGLQLAEKMEHANAFVLGALSPAERSAVELLVRQGLSYQEIADHLSLSPRTVEQHLRSAYRKAAAHWSLEAVSGPQLVALLGLYYATRLSGAAQN